jgi:hypothetical protein
MWRDGCLIGTISGAYGAGVRIMANDRITCTKLPDDGSGVRVLEVEIDSRAETKAPMDGGANAKGNRKKSH